MLLFDDDEKQKLINAIETVTETSICEDCTGKCNLSKAGCCATMILREFAECLKVNGGCADELRDTTKDKDWETKEAHQ